jgi:CGNR zinc finger
VATRDISEEDNPSRRVADVSNGDALDPDETSLAESFAVRLSHSFGAPAMPLRTPRPSATRYVQRSPVDHCCGSERSRRARFPRTLNVSPIGSPGDQSRGGRRRWCSMADCGNRAKARAHYNRQRRASG